MTEADTSRTHAREGGAVEPVAWVERTEDGLTRMWSGDLSKWANRPANPEPLYSQATVDTLRAQLEAAERFKVAFEEWHAKTEWVQETAQPRELGKHRADVLRERIQSAEARAEAAEADAIRWRTWRALDEQAAADIAWTGGGAEDRDAAIAARTKEAAP